MDIISILRQKDCFASLSGVDESTIKTAEDKLGLVFCSDYRQYVSEFGAVSYYGHELTGVTNAPALDVVRVTEAERDFAENVPHEWYVIERLNIDGVSIWQDSKTGRIFKTSPNAAPVKICESLLKYIALD